ncbi:MAG: thrombospondin type 3 repeat-containing protein, partial [Polyangia bacterium]|nr:thrombospondin type 3 repeat-containing protein [Polyangia bacterium]
MTVDFTTPSYNQQGQLCALFTKTAAMEVEVAIASTFRWPSEPGWAQFTTSVGWGGWGQADLRRGFRLSIRDIYGCLGNWQHLIFMQHHGVVEGCLNPYNQYDPLLGRDTYESDPRVCERCGRLLDLDPRQVPNCSPWQHGSDRVLYYRSTGWSHLMDVTGDKSSADLRRLAAHIFDGGPVIAELLPFYQDRTCHSWERNATKGHAVLLIGYDVPQDALLVSDPQSGEPFYWISYSDWAGTYLPDGSGSGCDLRGQKLSQIGDALLPLPVVWGDIDDPAIGPTAPDLSSNFDRVCTLLTPDGDEDGDGVDIFNDNCRGTYNPDQADMDLDGVGDACDNCAGLPNQDQADLDGDGIGNACDGDIDGDGVPNAYDCHPYHYTHTETGAPDDPIWRDMDDDGVCELQTTSPYRNAVDRCLQRCHVAAALDPRIDLKPCQDRCPADNCPTWREIPELPSCQTSLVNQRLGLPAEPECVALYANPGQTDTDDDGVGDHCDNCRWKGNPDQVNSDADEHGDACDNCPEVSNQDQADWNADGLGDAWQDTDDDGVIDLYDCEPGSGMLAYDLDTDGVCEPEPGFNQADCELDCHTNYGERGLDPARCVARCAAMDNCPCREPAACPTSEPYQQYLEGYYQQHCVTHKNCIDSGEADCGSRTSADICHAFFSNPDQADTNRNNVGDRCESTPRGRIAAFYPDRIAHHDKGHVCISRAQHYYVEVATEGGTISAHGRLVKFHPLYQRTSVGACGCTANEIQNGECDDERHCPTGDEYNSAGRLAW